MWTICCNLSASGKTRENGEEGGDRVFSSGWLIRMSDINCSRFEVGQTFCFCVSYACCTVF